jgi:hypothetical protein
VDVESAAAGSALSFGVEFRAEDGRVVAGEWAQLWGTRFEAGCPARAFASFKGQGCFPGWWWASTTSSHIGFESWLERDNLMLLDFDPEVVGICSQPFWLSWQVDGGGWRRHLPDYFARLADGSGLVVDVRADDRIGGRDAEAFAATRAACTQVGWGFRRVGGLDPVFAANLRWLSRYRHPRNAGAEKVRALLVEAFAQPMELFVGAQRAGDRLASLPVLYHLLWRSVLHTDLRGRVLGPDSVVATCSAAPAC